MKYFVLFLLLFFSLKDSFAQDFFEDGSMVITEVSENPLYGYDSTQSNAIKVGSIRNQRPYLEGLRGPNGESVKYFRVGSCCAFNTSGSPLGAGLMDKYQLIYEGLKKPVFIFLNGYDYEQPKAPAGFTFALSSMIEKPYEFPQDSVRKMNFCDEKKMYSPVSPILKDITGDLPVPDKNPKWKGITKEFIKYFNLHPLEEPGLNNVAFKVSVALLVNCNGESGNFVLLTGGRGAIESASNKVLQRINSIPSNWKPAIKNKIAVDAFQILTLIIAGGKLVSVEYL